MPNPEEYRRTRRIVELLMLITRQPRRWTRRALAERYELSEQQIDKDVLLLRHGLRMPLRHSPGGYYFDGPVALPTLTLTLPEALSLLLAARLGYNMPGVPRGDLGAAIARVEALLPDELLPLVGALDRGGRGDASSSGLLRELQMAIAERAQLRIAYRSASHPQSDAAAGAHSQPTGAIAPSAPSVVGAGGPAGPPTGEYDCVASAGLPTPTSGRAGTAPRPCRVDGGEGITPNPTPGTPPAARGARTVDPYTLIPDQRSWYLVAYCHLRGEVRTFKVSRIDRIERTGEEFVFPKDFDLADYMGHAWGLLRGEAGEPEQVELEFEADTGRWVRDQQLHESQRAETLPDGSVRLSFYVGITPEFRHWVLGFGRRVRVVQPASLGQWVAGEARAMVEGDDRRQASTVSDQPSAGTMEGFEHV